MSLDRFTTMYLDWVNNFLTVERFAEYYAITVSDAAEIIRLGRKIDQLETTHVIY